MKFLKTLSYTGKVIKGDGFGKKLGFPTANFDRRQWSRQKLKLKHGVYGGTALLPSGKTYKAGIVLGPIDKTGLPKIEAHLIGFTGNLYNQSATLNINFYVRPYKNFKTMDLLKQQIKHDIQQVIKLIKL